MERLVMVTNAANVAVGVVDATSPDGTHARVVDDGEARASDVEWPVVVALVRRQMRSFVGGGRDLEDLTQTALERICRSVENFDGRSEFATYTYRVCLRVALNHWRWYKRWLRRFERATEMTPEPAASGPDIDEAVIQQERLVQLERALDRLAPIKRAVLTLCELEELPASRVAEIMSCPEATVRSRLRQARVDLAIILRADRASESANANANANERAP